MNPTILRSIPMPLVVLAAVVAMCVGTARAQSSGEMADRLSDARESLAKWVETQQIISREREDWQVGKDVLEQRIALVSGEIEDLEGRIAELRNGIGETDRRRVEMESEKRTYERASVVLADGIGELERKVRVLVERLPDPIQSRVRPLSQKIPKDPAATEQSLSQRFQNVVGVLNEVNKFNRDITVTSELRPLPDGSTVEVRALYIGLGQGYYVSPDGASAGYGRPGDAGWEWTPADDMAPQVARAIAILQNEDVPAFVPLPVDIR